MNKTFAVVILATASLIVFVGVSWWGDVFSSTTTSPFGFSASGKIQRESKDATPAVQAIPESESAPAPSMPDHLAQRYDAVSHNTQLPTLDARMAALHEHYPYREFTPEQVLDLMAQPTAWRNAAAADDLPLTDVQRNDGREFIEMNPERLEVLLPGDTFELPLEKLGMRLQMQVDSREALASGGFTLHGRVLGGDETLRVTITQSGGLSLAGIDTPQGHVVMQANDTQGWIASSETLFKQDPHTTDMVMPHDE